MATAATSGGSLKNEETSWDFVIWCSATRKGRDLIDRVYDNPTLIMTAFVSIDKHQLSVDKLEFNINYFKLDKLRKQKTGAAMPCGAK